MWGEVYAASPAFREAADELSRVQKARAEDPLDFQLTDQVEAAFGDGRQKSRFYGPQKGEQGRIRAAMTRRAVMGATAGVFRHKSIINTPVTSYAQV